MANTYDGKCFCVVTSASKEFGRSITQLLLQESGLLHNAESGSKILLMARNNSGLESTKEISLKTAFKPERFQFDLCTIDFSTPEAVQDIVKKYLETLDTEFKHVFIFSNAGFLGDVSKTLVDHDNICDIQIVVNINVISPSYIISNFCKHFKSSRCFVINTSSHAALKPMPSIGLYCSVKACMDMFMQNLTMDCPSIRTLNYAPGPMDTDMAERLMNEAGNKDISNFFKTLFREGTIVKPIDSATKLMLLLKKNEFTSGVHIDYYDKRN